MLNTELPITQILSNVNFCNLCLKICVQKKKKSGPTILLESYIQRKCLPYMSNVKSHAGWSIFLCDLSEKECSEQVSENFINGKVFSR